MPCWHVLLLCHHSWVPRDSKTVTTVAEGLCRIKVREGPGARGHTRVLCNPRRRVNGASEPSGRMFLSMNEFVAYARGYVSRPIDRRPTITNLANGKCQRRCHRWPRSVAPPRPLLRTQAFSMYATRPIHKHVFIHRTAQVHSVCYLRVNIQWIWKEINN